MQNFMDLQHKTAQKHDEQASVALFADLCERQHDLEQRCRVKDEQVCAAKAAVESVCQGDGGQQQEYLVSEARKQQSAAAEAHARTVAEWQAMLSERESLKMRHSEVQRVVEDLKDRLKGAEAEASALQVQLDCMHKSIGDACERMQINVCTLSDACKTVFDLEASHKDAVHKAALNLRRLQQERAALDAERKELDALWEARQTEVARKKGRRQDHSFSLDEFHKETGPRLLSAFQTALHGTYMVSTPSSSSSSAAKAPGAVHFCSLPPAVAVPSLANDDDEDEEEEEEEKQVSPSSSSFSSSSSSAWVPEEKVPAASSAKAPYHGRLTHPEFLKGREYIAGSILNVMKIVWYCMLEVQHLKRDASILDWDFDRQLQGIGSRCVLSMVEDAMLGDQGVVHSAAGGGSDPNDDEAGSRKRKCSSEKDPVTQMMQSVYKVACKTYGIAQGPLASRIDEFQNSAAWTRVNRDNVLKVLRACVRHIVCHRRRIHELRRNAVSCFGTPAGAMLLTPDEMHFEGREDMLVELARWI